VSGYAARFGVLSLNLGGFREVIAPGAFAQALKGADVRALLNHENWPILGRTSAGTLRLWEDGQGLAFSLDLPEIPIVRELVVALERGDLTGTSFAFLGVEDAWDVHDSVPVRTIRSFGELRDVSLVTFPAYADAEASLVLRAAAPPSTPRKDAVLARLGRPAR
jgi:HK97 family phage prohead protease